MGNILFYIFAFLLVNILARFIDFVIGGFCTLLLVVFFGYTINPTVKIRERLVMGFLIVNLLTIINIIFAFLANRNHFFELFTLMFMRENSWEEARLVYLRFVSVNLLLLYIGIGIRILVDKICKVNKKNVGGV